VYGWDVAALPAETPRLFDHRLDPSLFADDRLDWLCREAERRGLLKVQFADPGRQRHGLDPIYTRPRYPLRQDVLERPIQYRINGVASWGGPEYAAAFDHVMDVAASDPVYGRVDPTSVVRVFSPHAVVALHGDPDTKLVCDVSGSTIWHVRHPDEMSAEEHERLLRGGFFLRWRDAPEQALEIPPGRGCVVPSRWAHWLSHPSDEPIVSFELGYWTYDAVRQRKVEDVNWLLRRARLRPRPPGQGRDRLKARTFDAISTVTRRGRQYRGIV
jgi:hypothetical protein